MRQSNTCQGCLFDDLCTADDFSTNNTSLFEYDDICEHYGEAVEPFMSQYLQDLIDRQSYYERGSDDDTFGFGIEPRTLRRILREYGL